MTLDQDDPRPPYLQIAHSLRAAILTRRYAPGERLPSGGELATQYGVARMTVQQALKVLRDEGLTYSRAGSGVFVRERTERPVGLRPHVERSFEADKVRIDFAGFSGETLHGALQEPLDKVRGGRYAPKSVRIRILVPDTATPWALPCSAGTLEDDPAFRTRAAGISGRHLTGIRDAVVELAELGLVQEATVDIRVHQVAPLFKLYVLNGQETFFGFYPVVERSVRIRGKDHRIFDLMGKDTVLFHYGADADPHSLEGQFVQQGLAWFDSVWHTLAQPYQS